MTLRTDLTNSTAMTDIHAAQHNEANQAILDLQSPTNLAPSGLTGAVATSRYAGATTSGAPTTGTFSAGDFVVDQSGNMWVCFSGGSPGSWRSVGSGRELGYAEITSNFQNTGSALDVTGLLISVDVGSRPIQVIFGGQYSNSTAGQGSLGGIKQDGTQIHNSQAVATTSGVQIGLTIVRRLSLSPGTYAFQATLARFNSGTSTLAASSTQPAYITAIEI